MENEGPNLIIKERNLLRDVLNDQLEFKPEVLTCEHRVVVLIDISIVASCLCFSNLLQGIRESGYTAFKSANMFLLVLEKEG